MIKRTVLTWMILLVARMALVPATAAPAVLEAGFEMSEKACVSGLFTQITFGPDGRLYATDYAHDEILAFDYDSGRIIGGPVTVASGVGSFLLGLAFDEDGCLYASSNEGADNSGFLVRLLDQDDDGFYETHQPFVTNLPNELHHNNQLLIDSGFLYFGQGSRTDDGERDAVSGDENGDGVVGLDDFAAWPACMGGRGAGLSTPDCGIFDFDGSDSVDLADHQSFGQVFGTSPLRPATVLRVALDSVDFDSSNNVASVYARGLRNAFGIALDEFGNLWVGENGADQDGVEPDELHMVIAGAHHGFPADLAPPGFVPHVDLMGYGTSADGLAVYPTSGPWGGDYADNVFIARFSSGTGPSSGEGEDVVRVVLDRSDPDRPTGVSSVFAVDFNQPLDVEVDPYGNLLIMEFGGPACIYRVVNTMAVGSRARAGAER